MTTPTEINRELRGHAFYPSDAELANVPKLYGTERVAERDKTVVLHYFIGGCDWWLVELDPSEMLAFGYACLGDPQSAEWGYVSLVELESMAIGPIVVERDLWWAPKLVRDCKLPGWR